MTTEPSPSLSSDALRPLREAVHAYVQSRVHDPALADDLTQETFRRMLINLGKLRQSDRLHAWLFRIARNTVADHFRASKSSEVFDEETHVPATETVRAGPLLTEEEWLREELAAYVRSVIERLPAIYRDALQSTEFEGVSQADLARRLGLSPSAAKSRVQRARAMVRAEMERCCRWETDRYGTVVGMQPKRNSPSCDHRVCRSRPK